ncbi:TVP38/TMEM64 family protein [Streptacidiphilus jiangxiensis]|uniref:TVP38/TMEM64 family protein n=1 Tax=Streptacidiphilus jiangxiensis TaxID=235985 RepID=UPI000943A8D9|nr:VTT domain-containing protein [Streptacidiphilus jiangxiensis]
MARLSLRRPGRAGMLVGAAGLAVVAVGVLVAVGATSAQRLVAHAVAGSDPLAGLPPLLAGAVFVLLYAVATVVLVPKPVLNLAAGAWFGTAVGLPLAVAATTLGATASFALGRAALRGRRFAFLERRGFATLDRELRDHGFRAVLAMRLLPVLPFAAINYGCAIGGTRPAPFAAATALGVIPGTAALVLAGATASAPSTTGTWTSLGALVLLGGVSLLPRARRASAPASAPHHLVDGG